MPRLKTYAGLCALALLSANALRAQTATGGSSLLDIISAQQELGITLSQNVKHDFASDLYDVTLPGDLAVTSYNTSLDYAVNWGRGFLRAGVSYTYTDWDWGGPISYFGDTSKINAQTIFGQRFVDSDWGMVATFGVTFAAENDGGDLARGGRYQAGVAATYYLSDRDSISFGIMVVGQNQRDVRYYPLPIINWQITEDLNLRTFNGFTLTYDAFSDNTTIFDLTTQYDDDAFSIKPKNLPFGQTTDQLVENATVTVAAGWTQRFGQFYFRAYVEGVVYRKMEFRYNHATHDTLKSDPSVGIGLQAGINF